MPEHLRRLARDVRRTPTVMTLQYVQGLIALKRTHIENKQRRLMELEQHVQGLIADKRTHIENEQRRLMELEAMEAELLSVVK